MSDSIIAGVDIGGSHITVALINVQTRQILEHTWMRESVNTQESVENILTGWSEVILKSFRSHGVNPGKVGIAIPGPFDYKKGIALMKNQNKFDALYGRNVKELLAERLSIDSCDIRFANDAACFVQGEVFNGVAKGFRRVLGLTLGTGLGAARFTGEVAEDANFWCLPFREGIAEDYLSGRWLVARHRALGGHLVPGVKELAEAAASDPLVEPVFEEFGVSLGTFLVPILSDEGHELVVIGGNIAMAFPLFSAALHSVLRQNHLNTNLCTTALGERAALLGAASNVLEPERWLKRAV